MAYGRRPQAPSGAALLGELKQRLAQGWPDGLTLLTGKDLYHLDRAQRLLIEALVPAEATDFGLTVYSEQRIDVGVAVAAARSLGMFASRRVVLVRDLAILEGEPDAILEYSKQPPSASHLIIRAPDLDKRRKLHKALLTAGNVLTFQAAEADQAASLASDIQTMGGERGVKLDRPSATLLAEICACDFYRIATELDKLAAWVKPGESVNTERLRQVATGAATLSGWEVASAISRADGAAALAELDRLLQAGEEPLRMLGGLAYRARGLLQARALIEGGMAPERAIQTARIWGDPPQSIAAGLRKIGLAQALSFPRLLLEADRALKSRSLAARAVLGSTVERMVPPP